MALNIEHQDGTPILTIVSVVYLMTEEFIKNLGDLPGIIGILVGISVIFMNAAKFLRTVFEKDEKDRNLLDMITSWWAKRKKK